MHSSVPSGLLPSEVPAMDILEKAVLRCAERGKEMPDRALEKLRCGDPDAHSTFRYEIARLLSQYLCSLGVSFRAVYVYGSAMRGHSTRCSDLDLLVVVSRRRDEISRLLLRLDLALATAYRRLLEGQAAPSSLLDIRLIDMQEEEERQGYGAILSGLETCPVCLWRFDPEVRTGTPREGSPRRSPVDATAR